MLQFITNGTCDTEIVAQVVEALAGGCKFIQVRMKEADDADVERVLRTVTPVAHALGARVVVDDRVGLVEYCDGVHLGRNDMHPDEARRIIGPEKLIGVTVNDAGDIERINGCSFDSIGLGPWRFTKTKKNLAPCLGASGVTELISGLREAKIKQPVYVIGGVELGDIPAIMNAGAQGIAVSGYITGAEDPVSVIRQIIKALREFYANK